jgi:hypothetical protein
VVVVGAVRAAGQGVIGDGFFVWQFDHGVPFCLTVRQDDFQRATRGYLTVLNN